VANRVLLETAILFYNADITVPTNYCDKKKKKKNSKVGWNYHVSIVE
jgi:hypothetical protein